jgi:hypothetical protein
MSRRSSPVIHLEPDNTVQTYFELADLLPPLSSLGLVQSLARVLSQVCLSGALPTICATAPPTCSPRSTSSRAL